jgi:hypothetical protein
VFETNAGYQVSRKATQTDKASLRCDSKDVKLSKFGYVQAWHHDYSTSKHCCLWLPPAPGAGATGMVPSAAAMAALTILPATPSSYLQPLMLTMGGLLQSTYGEFERWMERRPLYDWTGLDSTWLTKSKSLNQLHPTSSSAAQKSYNYHKKGLKTLFDCGSDLSIFQTALPKKFQDTSMDTIMYMLHPKACFCLVSSGCKVKWNLMVGHNAHLITEYFLCSCKKSS